MADAQCPYRPSRWRTASVYSFRDVTSLDQARKNRVLMPDKDCKCRDAIEALLGITEFKCFLDVQAAEVIHERKRVSRLHR